MMSYSKSYKFCGFKHFDSYRTIIPSEYTSQSKGSMSFSEISFLSDSNNSGAM